MSLPDFMAHLQIRSGALIKVGLELPRRLIEPDDLALALARPVPDLITDVHLPARLVLKLQSFKTAGPVGDELLEFLFGRERWMTIINGRRDNSTQVRNW